MAVSRASRPGHETEDDLRPVLHDEIDRLPESQRLPIVLCDLEGLTYDQAARQLRWTVPTLRCRLAKARQRLKCRLTRRGFVGAAAGAALAAKEARAVVPPVLMRSTVLAATGASASAGVALLTQVLLREMLMTKVKFVTTAAPAALALASAGVIAAAGRLPDDAKPAMKPKAERAGVIREKSAPEKPLETVEIRARVVAPDGKPVAGAAVAAVYISRDEELPWLKTTSGTDGRFSIRVPKAEGNASAEGHFSMYPWLVASAPGYGVGWCERALRADRPAEQVVTLVEEGPPIEGKIVDLEGRPVAGASIHAARIWYDEKRDIAGWIAKARNGAAGNLWQGLENLSVDAVPTRLGRGSSERLVTIAATTGADGRFKLTGIGRDRIADLIISGQGIATTQVYAFSRTEPEIHTVDRGMMRSEPFIVHASQFEVALAPSRRVHGTIRDKESGKPIAGLEIQAAVFDEHSLIPAPGVEASTDAEGRYRLDGLSKAPAYRLFIKPNRGLPYTNASLKVSAETPGLEPITFDIAMKRGIVVRGRVTDKLTGRPIHGQAIYYAFADNPHARAYSGFSEGQESYAPFDEKGRYEVVVLPGRGIIAVREEQERYRPATGYEKIAGYDAKQQDFDTLPEALFPEAHAIIAEIVVDPKAESISLDLQADPGKSVPIEVVGPDGAPIGETKAKGVSELYQTGSVPQASSSFEVYALDPSRPRRVIAMHEGRKLIGTALLRGTETGPVTIKLEPWCTVAGRIVDDEGRPRKGMFIGSPGGSENKHPETHDILPGSDWNDGIRVGDDGRFLVEGLVPGLKYSANARTGFEAFGDLFVDVTGASGETKDLGDLKFQPPKKPDE
jgi:Sigma-70, region 4